MTPRQQTLRGIAVALAVALSSGVIALVVEFRAIAMGGNSTISEIVWSAWAAQPGAFLAVLVPLAFGAGFLAGHFFWQSKPVYDAERAGVDLGLAVQTALKLRAMFEAEAEAEALSRMTKPGDLSMPVSDSLYAGRARAATGGIYYPQWLRDFARDRRA